MAVNDIVQLAVEYDVVGGEGNFVNVIHYRQSAYDGITSQGALGSFLADGLNQLTQVNYLPTVSSSITLFQTTFFFVNNPIVGGVESSGIAGGALVDLVSLRSAPVCKKITGLRGRSFRGRIFLMPITEGQQDAGQISAAHETVLQTYLDSILQISDGMGNIFNMTVYSPTLSNPSMGVFLDNLVTSIIINPALGSLRGRQSVS